MENGGRKIGMRAIARIPRAGAGDKILRLGGGYGTARESLGKKLVFSLKLSL